MDASVRFYTDELETKYLIL